MFAKKHDQSFFKDLDFQNSKLSVQEQEEMRLYNKSDGILMFLKSRNFAKDFVSKIKILEFGELKAKAKKLAHNI